MRITSQSRLAKLTQIIASNTRPFLVCKTCGLTTDKVIARYNDSLRNSPDKERQKTWTRLVKYSRFRRSHYHGRECRAKEIFFSYAMLGCIKKKHKITIRRAPFSAKLVSVVV